MKKTLATFSLGVALLLFANACTKTEYELTGNIAGTVIEIGDDNVAGDPIQGVTVTINPNSKNTYTGSDGSFEFKDLEATNYKVSVQKSGYKTNFKDISVNAGETTKISLTMEKR